MSKKKSKKHTGKRKTTQSVNQDLRPSIKKNLISLPNLSGLIISLLLLFILYQNTSGYKWVWDSLVIGNLKIIWDNPDLTREKKWEIKCGFDYVYANYLKNNTPDNAVILLPPVDMLYTKGEKSDFNTKDSWGIKNKAWTTYFVYPRKLIYETEKETNPYYDKVNYVAIANYWGYEKLKYFVPQKQKYHVLPFK